MTRDLQATLIASVATMTKLYAELLAFVALVRRTKLVQAVQTVQVVSRRSKDSEGDAGGEGRADFLRASEIAGADLFRP